MKSKQIIKKIKPKKRKPELSIDTLLRLLKRKSKTAAAKARVEIEYARQRTSNALWELRQLESRCNEMIGMADPTPAGESFFLKRVAEIASARQSSDKYIEKILIPILSSRAGSFYYDGLHMVSCEAIKSGKYIIVSRPYAILDLEMVHSASDLLARHPQPAS